jgi:nitrogen fixation protein FixH
MNMDRPLTGRTVLYAMLAFFGVIIAVNGTFLYFALSSFPGLSTEHAYEEGVAYNQTLALAARQNAAGWVSQVSFSQPETINLTLTGPSGTGVGGLALEGLLMRPAHNRLDQKMPLVEVRPGQYRGVVSKALPGRWRLEVTARQNDEQIYFKVHELTIPQ